MKVKELIKHLEGLNPESTVITSSSNFELNNSDIEVSFVHQYDNGCVKTRQFRDAFDNTGYSHEVWSLSGGNIPVVMIS